MLKPGDHVVMHTCVEAEKYDGLIWEIASEPWELSGSEVVKLKGFSGGFATKFLQKLALPAAPEQPAILNTTDMATLMNHALEQIKSEGLIEQAIKTEMSKTIKEIVHDLFREYSEFGKSVKKALEEYLNVNLGQYLGLSGYNVLVQQLLKELLDEAIHEQGLARMKELVDDILGVAKKEVKLSELIEEMKQDVDDDDHGDEITLHVKRGGLHFLYFDPGEGVRDYNCKYRVSVDGKTNVINTVQIEGKDLGHKGIMAGLHGVDRTLFQLFATGGKLILDEDAVDLEYPEREEED